MIGATLFSGFEGAGIAMQQAGISHAWGIELEDDIAAVARLNGFNVYTADILTVDPHTMPAVDLLHASPPCPNFSQANPGGEETELDIALARKTADFVDALRPAVFTLENVYKYRHSQSWGIIRNVLYECGYWLDVAHVNFADHGVPQTRKRMVVRAMHGRMVPWLPPAGRWQGWYGAIEDILDTLPESEFADWQLERLPAEMVTAGVLLDSRNTGQEYGKRHRTADEPSISVTVTDRPSHMPRAFLVSGGQGDILKTGQKHATCRNEGEPAFTTTAGEVKRPTRAWLSHGRVVSMTARALARFQGFPDWYALPDKSALACTGIGNAVPPAGMATIYRGLTHEQ